MRKQLKNITLKTTLLLLAGVMILLIANDSIYIHTHINDQGKLITHAHPFNKAEDNKPIKSHHHSDAEYLFYDNFKILLVILSITFCFITFLIDRSFKASIYTSTAKATCCTNIGRAPPQFLKLT